MEKIVKIKDIKLRNFNNAEYTQFLSNTEQLLQTAGAGHLRIDAGLLAEFRDNIQKLTDISFQSRASTETEELAKLDKQRDDLAVYLLAAFRVERKSPIIPRREAAAKLYTITKNYIGVQSLPNRQETQVLEGLVTDLEKPENQMLLINLNLAEVLSQLKNANYEYKRLTAGRADSQILNTVESAKKVRKLTDEQYDELITRAFVASVAFPSQETKAFVTSINKLIDDTRKAYKQRLAHTKKTEKENPAQPKSNN